MTLQFTKEAIVYFAGRMFCIQPINDLLSMVDNGKDLIKSYQTDAILAHNNIYKLFLLNRYGTLRLPMTQPNLEQCSADIKQDVTTLCQNIICLIKTRNTSNFSTIFELVQKMLPNIREQITGIKDLQDKRIPALQNIEDILLYIGVSLLRSAKYNDDTVVQILTKYSYESENYFTLLDLYNTAYAKSKNTKYLRDAETFRTIQNDGETPITKVIQWTKNDKNNALLEATVEAYSCIYHTLLEIYHVYNTPLYNETLQKIHQLQKITEYRLEIDAYGTSWNCDRIQEVILNNIDGITTNAPGYILQFISKARDEYKITDSLARYLEIYSDCIHYAARNQANNIQHRISTALHTIAEVNNKIQLVILGIKHILKTADINHATTLLKHGDSLQFGEGLYVFEYYYYRYITYERLKNASEMNTSLRKLNDTYDKATEMKIEISHDSIASKIIIHANELHLLNLLSTDSQSTEGKISSTNHKLATKYLSYIKNLEKYTEYTALLATYKIYENTAEWSERINIPVGKIQSAKPSSSKSKASKSSGHKPEKPIAPHTKEDGSVATSEDVTHTTATSTARQQSTQLQCDDASTTDETTNAHLPAITTPHKYAVTLPTKIIDFSMMLDVGTIKFEHFADHHDLIPKLQTYYHRHKHLKLSQYQFDDIVNYSTSWKINGQEYKSSDAFVYQITSMHHCYSAIRTDMNLEDTILFNKFKAALSYGRIAREREQSGIKIFSDIVELKINDSDFRLVAKVYQNIKGSILFLFDQIKTHQEVKDSVKPSKTLDLIHCDMVQDHINPSMADMYNKVLAQNLHKLEQDYASLSGINISCITEFEI